MWFSTFENLDAFSEKKAAKKIHGESNRASGTEKSPPLLKEISKGHMMVNDP